MDEFIESVGTGVDLAGVAVIVGGAVIASVLFIRGLISRTEDAFRTFRRSLGRAILLGLEFLVAGDIIKTVAVEPTFSSVGVLAGIVLIRTFLSFSLEVELSGRWPWQKRSEPNAT